MTIQNTISTSRLITIGIFSDVPHAALKRMAASAVVRHLAANTAVFSQGDGPARAHVILSGAVRIVQTGSDGEQTLMRFVVPGDVFGAVALFVDGRYPASAETLVDTVEASWSEAELLGWTKSYPALATNFMRLMGRRLQETQSRLRESATQSAERRIAHALLRLSHQNGVTNIDGVTIAFPLRRKDVADLALTTLFTASRVMTAWEKMGLIINNHRRLTLRAPERIQAIAENSGR